MSTPEQRALDFERDRNHAQVRAEQAEAEVERLQEELDEHRAHYVDPREYQRLRDRITALADEWEADPSAGRWHAARVRALLEQS